MTNKNKNKNKIIKILTLTTVHNRKNKTIKAITDIYKQKLTNNIKLSHCVVDDGSSDGTAEIISEKFPDVEIIKGDGNLFWAGGMVFGLKHSKKLKCFDYLFAYNDDIRLYHNALQRLIETSNQYINEKGVKEHIVVGSFKEFFNQNITYGGLVRSSWWHPLRFKLIEPPKEGYVFVDTLSMNACLISYSAIKKNGFLNKEFVHATADIDYGLSLNKNGGKIILCANYLGTCLGNSSKDKYLQEAKNLFDAFKKSINVKHSPLKSRLILLKKHGGFFFPIFFMMSFLYFPLKYFVKKYLR